MLPGLQLVFIEFAEKGVQEGLEFIERIARFDVGHIPLLVLPKRRFRG